LKSESSCSEGGSSWVAWAWLHGNRGADRDIGVLHLTFVVVTRLSHARLDLSRLDHSGLCHSGLQHSGLHHLRLLLELDLLELLLLRVSIGLVLHDKLLLMLLLCIECRILNARVLSVKG